MKTASSIVTKFLENYFVLEIIENENKKAIEGEPEEKKESEKKKDEQVKKMSESFYQKEGLDYLQFNRPGTAYNNPEAFGKDSAAMKMMGTSTRFNFFDPSQQRKQSIEALAAKNQKSKALMKCLWMERAQKTVKNVKHLLELLDSFDYVSEVSNRLKVEVIPNL